MSSSEAASIDATTCHIFRGVNDIPKCNSLSNPMQRLQKPIEGHDPVVTKGRTVILILQGLT